MSLAINALIGIIPAGIGALMQAPPYTALLFLILGVPLMSALGRRSRLKAGTIIILGILHGLILAFTVEYFPSWSLHNLPYVPKEHVLLADLWGLFSGLTGVYILWYIGFDSREG